MTASVTGGRFRMLTVMDEFIRECLAIGTERSLKSKNMQETLAQIMLERGRSGYFRSKYGSGFIAYNLRQWLKSKGTGAIFIAPCHP